MIEQLALTRIKTKVRMEPELHAQATVLAKAADISLSECVESMIMLVRGVYNLGEGEDVIFAIRDLKYSSLLNAESIRKMPQRKSCHLTLHPEAISFAALLRTTYPPVFSSLNEAYELCIRYCCQYCGNKASMRYLTSRLKDVRSMRTCS